MMAALMAHIAEHTAFAYRAQVEMALGAPLPPLDDENESPLAPEDEKALAPLIAAAAQQTMIQNRAAMAQQQAQQQAQDPTLQLQAKELELKERDSDRKDQDSLRDFEIARGKLALEAAKIRKDNPQAKAVAAQQEIVLKGARARQEMTHKDQMHRLKLQQQAEQRAARSQPKEK